MLKFNQAATVHIAALLLLVLTLVSLGLSRYLPHTWWLTVTLVLLTVIKGQQITDVFMELKHAPVNWRFWLLAYVVLLPILLGAILFY